MCLEMALQTECFITHTAGKRPYTAMYTLMTLQFPLISERLITEVAAIFALLFKVSESAL
jgi:hypothetical protein